MIKPLLPDRTLGCIYGPCRFFAPRAHQRTSQWISRDPVLLDWITGLLQSIVGDMPFVCSAGAASPAGMDLLADAGILPPTSMHTYPGEAQAIELMQDFIRCGSKVVLQHIYPRDLIAPDAMWIDPDLLSYLNNKQNLGTLVAPENLPQRTVCPSESIFSQPRRWPYPFVLKVGSNYSNGSGGAVAICHNDDDLAAARRRFGDCTNLIVESHLSIKQNLCLNYAVMPDGSVAYLGYSEQDVSQKGQYLGNWLQLGATLPPPLPEIGRKIADQAARLGYRGIVGIDIAVLSDGAIAVLDLNFRVNGSTPAILLAPNLLETLGPALLHLRAFTVTDGFERLIAISRRAVRDGRLIPLNCFDPEVAGHPGQIARLRGLVVGSSRSDILAVESRLASEGMA